MKKVKIRNVPRFENIKEIIYHSASEFPDNVAFTTKIKDGKDVTYIDHTYTNFLEDINAVGTSLYKLGLKEKRVAVLKHITWRHGFCTIRQGLTTWRIRKLFNKKRSRSYYV